MAQLATPDDFEARHGAADGRVGALLEDASAFILDEADGSEEEWVVEDDPATIPPSIVAICVEVAYRAWSNPEALSSEALGEYTKAWQNRTGAVLYLTKDEIRRVSKAAGLSSFTEVTLESPYSGPSVENDLIE